MLLVLVVTMGSCGGNKKNNLDSWEQANRLEPVTLTLYLPISPEFYSGYYGNQLLNEMPKALNERLKVINAKLEIGNVVFLNEPPPNRVRVVETYRMAILSGHKMDLFVINDASITRLENYTASSKLAYALKELGEYNLAADLTELFKNYAPKYYSRFEKEELDLLKYKGKLLAIPSLNYPVVKRTVAVVREDLMQRYKIRPIKSMDDFEKFLQTIRANERDMVPTLFGSTNIIYYALFDLFGRNYGYSDAGYGSIIVYHIDDPDMKLVPWERTPEFMDIARMMREWNSRKYVDEFREPDMLDVLSGKYASFISKTGAAEQYNQILKENGGKPWKYVEYELYPESTVLREFDPFPLICVNPRSPNKERAVMLIEVLMNDQKSYDIFKYGIENKDFRYDGDKKPTAMVPPGYKPDFDTYMLNHAKWSFRNIFMEHEKEKVVEEKLKSLKKNTVLNKLSGFAFNIEEYRELNVDTQNAYRAANQSRIVKGQMSDSEIQEFVESIKNNLDAVLNECQRQLDAWKSEQ